MEMSKELASLFQKLVKVRKAVPYLQKAEKGSQYAYVGSSQVLSALRDKLDEEGLLLIPKVIKTNLIQKDGVNAKGQSRTTYFTEMWLEYTWVDSATGANFSVPFYAQGVDFEGEKGVGKALTYAEKYFLLKQFNIATDKEDADAHQQKIESTTPRYITETQAKELLGYMEQFSKIKNVPIDSIVQQFNVSNVEKIEVSNYMAVRTTLLNWLQDSQQQVQQPPKTNVQESSQQHPIQVAPQQQTQPQPEQQFQVPPQANGNVQAFVITNIEEGVTPNNMPYMRVSVIDTTTNVEQLLICNTLEGMQTLRQLPLNTPLQLVTAFENGFTMFKGVA